MVVFAGEVPNIDIIENKIEEETQYLFIPAEIEPHYLTSVNDEEDNEFSLFPQGN